MNKLLTSRLLWGFVLVIGGILLLLDTFGIFEGSLLFWTLMLAAAGLLFLFFYITNRENWWALIPGIIFSTIAIAIGLDVFLPGVNITTFIGPIILGGIGLSFFMVYLAEKSNWWAIIPGGVLFTIAIVALIESGTTVLASGGIFFLGIGITFALVAILPNPAGPMRWAWIPAGILGLMGLLILVAAENLINYIWPTALIVSGGFLIWRAFRVRK